MNINRFMSAHLDQMARTNRFEVNMFGPSGIASRGVRCTAVTTPDKKIITEDHNYGGATPKRKYAKSVDYTNTITLSFMLDHTYEDRQLIELWQSSIYDEAYNLNYPESYYGSIDITQLGVDNIPVYTCSLHECYPTSVGSISFDASAAAEIQKFDVEFSFRTWSSKFENQPTGLLGGLFNKVSRKLESKIKKQISDKLFS